MIRNWLTQVRNGLFDARVQQSSKRRRSRHAAVEALEPRQLLTVRIWDGSALANDKWTDAANWVSNIAPVAGDDLVFPAGIGLLDRGTNNDFPQDTAFRNITVEADGYKLSGNRFKLTGDLQLNVPGTASANLEVKCDIKIGGGVHRLETTSTATRTIVFDNAIVDDGTAGTLLFVSNSGTGQITLKGNRANTYSKSISVSGIRLLLNKNDNIAAISGPLTVNGANSNVRVFDNVTGDRHALGQFKPGGAVTINDVRSNPASSVHVSRETLGKVTLNNGRLGIFPIKSSNAPEDDGLLIVQQTVQSTGGTSTIEGERLQFSAFAGSREFIVSGGQLLLSSQLVGSNLVKKGVGALILSPADGPSSYTSLIVSEGQVTVPIAANNKAAIPKAVSVGTGAGSGTALLLLLAQNVVPDDATITTGSRGRFEMLGANETVFRLTQSFGGVSVLDRSTLNVTDDLRLNSGSRIQLINQSELNVGDDAFLDDGSAIVVGSTTNVVIEDDLTMRAGSIDSSGTVLLGNRLVVNAADSISGISGNFFLKKGAHDFIVADGTQSEDLVIFGTLFNEASKATNAVTINKSGAGTIRFIGSNRTTTTLVTQGNLSNDASLFTSNLFAKTGTQISGTGTAKSVNMNGGSVFRPGVTTPSVFHATNFAFTFGSTFAPVLNSTTAFDQLQTSFLFLDRFLVDGVPRFATLNVTRNFSVPLGTSFKIIDVTGTALPDPDTIFEDPNGVPLPDGASFKVNNQSFTIDYNGGDGNDVVITRNDAPAFANRKLTPVITEGQFATLSGHITEPNPDDTFFLDVDWGDGSTQTYRFRPGTPRDISVRHRYLDDPSSNTANDAYQVKILWHDQFGGSNKTVMQVQVKNAAPVVRNLTASLPATVAKPKKVSLRGTILDPGINDAHTVLIRWSSSEVLTQYKLPANSKSFQFDHVYTRPGTYLISLIVIDEDFGVIEKQLRVIIP